jgi:hypothetical protein
MRVLKVNVGLLGGLEFTENSVINATHKGQLLTCFTIKSYECCQPHYNEIGSKVITGKGIDCYGSQ